MILLLKHKLLYTVGIQFPGTGNVETIYDCIKLYRSYISSVLTYS